jgi:hypothetical protein
MIKLAFSWIYHFSNPFLRICPVILFDWSVVLLPFIFFSTVFITSKEYWSWEKDRSSLCFLFNGVSMVYVGSLVTINCRLKLNSHTDTVTLPSNIPPSSNIQQLIHTQSHILICWKSYFLCTLTLAFAWFSNSCTELNTPWLFLSVIPLNSVQRLCQRYHWYSRTGTGWHLRGGGLTRAKPAIRRSP